MEESCFLDEVGIMSHRERPYCHYNEARKGIRFVVGLKGGSRLDSVSTYGGGGSFKLILSSSGPVSFLPPNRSKYGYVAENTTWKLLLQRNALSCLSSFQTNFITRPFLCK